MGNVCYNVLNKINFIFIETVSPFGVDIENPILMILIKHGPGNTGSEAGLGRNFLHDLHIIFLKDIPDDDRFTCHQSPGCRIGVIHLQHHLLDQFHAVAI